MGSGALVEFSSIVEAMRRDVEIQPAYAALNADVPVRESHTLLTSSSARDAIYGDGVDVAKRLL